MCYNCKVRAHYANQSYNIALRMHQAWGTAPPPPPVQPPCGVDDPRNPFNMKDRKDQRHSPDLPPGHRSFSIHGPSSNPPITDRDVMEVDSEVDSEGDVIMGGTEPTGPDPGKAPNLSNDQLLVPEPMDGVTKTSSGSSRSKSPNPFDPFLGGESSNRTANTGYMNKTKNYIQNRTRNGNNRGRGNNTNKNRNNRGPARQAQQQHHLPRRGRLTRRWPTAPWWRSQPQ